MTEQAKQAFNEYQREWRKRNKEKVKEYKKRDRKWNVEKRREYDRKWRAAHLENVKAAQQRYWEKKAAQNGANTVERSENECMNMAE